MTSRKILETAKKSTDERFVQLEFDNPILFTGIIVDTESDNVGFLASGNESSEMSVKVVSPISQELLVKE